MKQSIYDPCLLHTDDKISFGVLGIQTDDTLIHWEMTFANSENQQIKEAMLLSKEREQLTQLHAIKFSNDCFFFRAYLTHARQLWVYYYGTTI